MKKIENKTIRQIVKKHNKLIKQLFKDDSNIKLNLSAIDVILKEINNNHKIGVHKHREVLSRELDFTKLCIVCASLISLSLYSDNEKEIVYPKDWLGNNAPNPNLVLSNFFLQISNYAISIVTLAEKGLDNPTRALARVLSELCAQTIILTANREDFVQYVDDKDGENSTKIWYKLFARGKLYKKVSKIEMEYGLAEELNSFLLNRRKEDYESFSEPIHHSFIAVNLGAYASKELHGDSFGTSLFGGENYTVKTSVDYVNENFMFFFSTFLRIIGPLKFPKKDFWTDVVSLQQSIHELYFLIYYPSVYKNK